VLLEGGFVPDRPIGGGETLRDIQWVDLIEDWDDGVRRILSVILPPDTPQTAPQERFLVLLFADLVNSTSLSELLSEVEFQGIIREVGGSVYAAVRKHGGSLEFTSGDGWVAAFEAAPEAISCALAIQDYVIGLSNPGTLNIRIGLAAGPVVRDHGGIFGLALRLAARICSLAKGGQILISEAVRLLDLGEGLQVTELGPVVLKGFAERVRIYEVQRPPQRK
jgi:adenylate cyclase